MIGALIGDVVGSRFERRRDPRCESLDFELFAPACRFTDDSVLTAAIADALLTPWKTAADIERNAAADIMNWARKYPDAGYGKRFRRWLWDGKPYGSYGNGSAMRVSPVGWFFEDIGKAEKTAVATAMPTHGHPEGIAAAKAVAVSIVIARATKDKAAIRRYCEKECGYDLSRTPEEIRPGYGFSSWARNSVPEALCCVIAANSFEEAVRLAVSLNGDTDTQAAIAGSVAEALWPVPKEFRDKVRSFVPDDIWETITRFEMEVL